MSESTTDEAPIIRIVNTILLYAIRDGADLVRIEPNEKSVEVFYRVVGEEEVKMKMPAHVLTPVVAFIKRIADIPLRPKERLGEWREEDAPDDAPLETEGRPGRGHISLKCGENFYSVHVSTELTVLGERVEMFFEPAEKAAED